jgi:hypothetical protein
MREQAQSLRRANAGGGAAKDSAAASRPAAARAPLAAAIATIDRSDPDAGRKAFRCFLEATLLRELGEQMDADPGFPVLVERVLATMEADVSLKPAIAEAGAVLLDTHGKAG